MKDAIQGMVRGLAALFLAMPGLALAYVGPGAGISAIGSFLALIMVVVVALFGFFWYPIKRLLKGKQDAVIEEEDSDTAQENTAGADAAAQRRESDKE